MENINNDIQKAISNRRSAIINNIHNNISEGEVVETVEDLMNKGYSVFTKEMLDNFDNDLKKAYSEGDVNDEELEKAVRDRSNLVAKKVTTKNGHQMTVWVSKQQSNKSDSKAITPNGVMQKKNPTKEELLSIKGKEDQLSHINRKRYDKMMEEHNDDDQPQKDSNASDTPKPSFSDLQKIVFLYEHKLDFKLKAKMNMGESKERAQKMLNKITKEIDDSLKKFNLPSVAEVKRQYKAKSNSSDDKPDSVKSDSTEDKKTSEKVSGQKLTQDTETTEKSKNISNSDKVDSKVDKEKEQLRSILSNMPSPSKYGGSGGSYTLLDEKNKKIHFKVSFPREARHPDEYGERGERAAEKMDQFDAEFYNKIYKPLEKLGYDISISA